jgi:hypothetical protein
VRSVTTIKVGKRAGRIGCCAIFLGIIRRSAIERRRTEEEEEKEEEERKKAEEKSSQAEGRGGASAVKDGEKKGSGAGEAAGAGARRRRLVDRARAYALSGSRDQPVLNVWAIDGADDADSTGGEHWVARLVGHDKPITCITVFQHCTDASRSMYVARF